MKTVIIGGVAGGATAAARLRRLDEQMEIVVFERGSYISYANCGLPYYIGDVIQDRNALLVQTVEGMRDKFNIDVRIQSEAVKIDPEKKTVTVAHDGETYEESYDELILAPGSSPIRPPIPGIDLPGIHILWTIPDTDAIREIVDEGAKSAVIIGGGFIGIEMAENLRARGMSVDLCEAQKQVMAPFDFEMAQLLHENIAMNGVTLHLGSGVASFEQTEHGIATVLADGTRIEADLVLLSIGLKPNTEIAQAAGIACTKRGSIIVDDTMKTSVPHIWAVGDAAQTRNLITGEPAQIRLAGPANKQGRVAANNICGRLDTYKGFLGTSVVKVFDFTAASTGLNEKTLQQAGKIKGKDYETVLISQKSHAGYYPKATPMYLKFLFGMDAKILGAQIVGQDGVDKRIDTISALLGKGGTAEDLTELETAYAPPYSSAKDPVNMLGFTAENVLNSLVRFAGPDELNGKTMLDIREDIEAAVWSFPDEIHIPLGQLRNRLDELDRDENYVVFCAIGVRSYNAARILMQNGFRHIEVLEGGCSFYKSFTWKPEQAAPPVIHISAEEEPAMKSADSNLQILNCSGLQCPGPIMKVNETMEGLADGTTLRVTATDMGFSRDIQAWCDRTGNTLVSTERDGVENIVTIRKGKGGSALAEKKTAAPVKEADGLTLILLDDDFDKVMAAFIIANGARTMGKEVNIFCTFWGLNVLKKDHKVPVKKTFMEKMFDIMMPRHTKGLPLTHMNMGGLGTKMMEAVMKSKNVTSLDDLMQQAIDNGVHLLACTMTMDVMGIKEEELMDGCELAGVATMLGAADSSNIQYFI